MGLFKMPKKTIALSIEESIYDKYKELCNKKVNVLSKQVELFMEEELKKVGEKDESKQ